MLRRFFVIILTTVFAFWLTSVNVVSANYNGPRIRAKNGSSTNWSGYAVETNLTNPANNAVSNVKGSWKVPAVNCANVTVNTYSSA